MKKILLVIQMILGFAFFVIGQSPILPSQPKYRVGVSYDKLNHQFGISYFSLKREQTTIKYDLGVKVFNLRDKNMAYEEIENYYTIQKTYRYNCFICWYSGSNERGADKILAGDTVNVYNGFYPKVAIPLSGTIGVRSKGRGRISGMIGASIGLTYISGLKVSSQAVEINQIDNTHHAEIVRMKQTVRTRKYSRVVFNVFADLGLELRIGKSYYLGFSTKYGFTANPIKSSIKYISFDNLFIRPDFVLSKDF